MVDWDAQSECERLTNKGSDNNIKEYSHDLDRHNFLNRTPKSLIIKNRSINWVKIKLRTSIHQKTPLKSEMENHSVERSICKIHTQHRTYTKNEWKTSSDQWGKDR